MKYQNVLELFGRAVERDPAHPAIDTVDGKISYAELEARAETLSEALISSGVPAGGIVAVLIENRATVVISLLGIMKAACVFVPLESNAPGQRIETMIAEVAPACILIGTELVETFAQIAAPQAKVFFVDPRGLCDETGRQVLKKRTDSGRSEGTRRELGLRDICYIFFTSGSTGKPKGIAGTRQGLDHFIHWERETLKPGVGLRVSQFPKPTFDAFLRDVFLPLTVGGTICIPPGKDAALLDTRRLIQWIDSQQINLIHCVPSLYRSLINAGPQQKHFSALKYILMAGEPLAPTDVKRWFEIFGDRVQLINLYGQSETTMAKFFYFVQLEDQHRRFIPIGKPMEGVRAIVVSDAGYPCTPGEIGEIYVRTPYRSLGYYRQPELTNEVFVPNPFSQDPSDVVYKTGDLGRLLEDGNFEFLGRKDAQVKIRGVRVEPGEVESLLRGHVAVADATVIDREDAYGNKYLCAYVVPRPGADLRLLKDFLRIRLPDYLVPSAIVALEALPLTPHGKVDRAALPVPEHYRLELKQEFIAPRTPTEEILARIWSELLGLEQVGVNDDFFDLGGHSMLIPQVIARINEAFTIELSLITFFEQTTISELAPSIAGIVRGETKQQLSYARQENS